MKAHWRDFIRWFLYWPQSLDVPVAYDEKQMNDTLAGMSRAERRDWKRFKQKHMREFHKGQK